MRRALLLFAPFVLAACPGPDGPKNPPKLWLTLIGNDETRVQLVPEEPTEPF